jgi:acyl transferase domain-containing protein
MSWRVPGEDAGTASAGYAAEPAFRSAVDRGLAVVEQVLPPEVFTAVRDAFLRGGAPDEKAVQPVLHLLAVGQHAFLSGLGITPDVLAGRGTGELTAAHLAGVLSFEDAARAVCWRSQAAGFARRMAEVRLNAPATPVVSGTTGAWLTAQEATDPGYWGVQLGEPAPFEDALRTVAEEHPGAVYLQLGGTQPVRGVPEDAGLVPETLLDAVAGLWERGVRVDWDAYAELDHARRVDVAPRAFARTPCLHPVLRDGCPGIDPAELTGERTD